MDRALTYILVTIYIGGICKQEVNFNFLNSNYAKWHAVARGNVSKTSPDNHSCKLHPQDNYISKWTLCFWVCKQIDGVNACIMC